MNLSSQPAAALVFIHGFIDGASAWDELVAALGSRAADALCVDLPGMGSRFRETGPFSLDSLAQDVAAQVRQLAKPVVLVGHSMGAQIAELVAGLVPDRVRGLALLTPVPLQGAGLPGDAIKGFHALGGDPVAQRQLRRQLSFSLTEERLEKLGRLGDAVAPASVGAFADLWNQGHALGAQKTLFPGPVLIVRGERDAFVTDSVVAQAVVPRFDHPAQACIGNAGHWPHVEQPEAVAGVLRTFLASLDAGAVAPQGWTQAFERKSATAFAEAFSSDIVLEASVLARPVVGIEQVKTVMGTASKIYEALSFTHEASSGARTYLEWEAQAFGGEKLSGITILTKNEHGKVVRAAIHHRPLGGALKFSAELGRRLQGQLDPTHFYGAL